MSKDKKVLVLKKETIEIKKWEFLELFYKILVFSQLYRSKSETLETPYDIEIDFLLCNLYFPLKQQSAKTLRTYIQI